MELDDVKDFIQFLSGHDIEQVELETENFRLLVRKPSAHGPTVAVTQPAPGVMASAPDGDEAPTAPAAEQSDPAHAFVKAPMVGTFYRAPAPDAPPYVQPGDIVEPGQPLCIIEAMKLMNEIEAETRGRVVEILVEDAQPVDYGQPLFVIEKA